MANLPHLHSTTQVKNKNNIEMGSIVPKDSFPSSVQSHGGSQNEAQSVAALPDVLRSQRGGAVPLSTQWTQKPHPLESRLAQWQHEQQKRQYSHLRQVFGVAEPTRRAMELAIVENSDGGSMANSGLHRDILLNRECDIGWEDVYGDGLASAALEPGTDLHTRMERHMGI